MRGIKIALFIIVTILFGTLCVLDSANVVTAAAAAVNTSATIIIPSLFAFMALSTFLINSGLYQIIFKPLYWLLKSFIKLSEEEMSIFLLSMIGGYPVGAKLLFDLAKRGDNITDSHKSLTNSTYNKSYNAVESDVETQNAPVLANTAYNNYYYAVESGVETEKTPWNINVAHNESYNAVERDVETENPSVKRAGELLPFCYCGGPMFLATIVGAALFADPAVGLLVYGINALSCVIIAVVCTNLPGFCSGKGGSVMKKTVSPTLLCVVTSVTSAARALLPVCAQIVFFGVIIELLRFCGVESSLLFAMLEISHISELSAASLSGYLLPAVAAFSSFGGLCIIFQVIALTTSADGALRIPIRRFVLTRIPAAAISAIAALFAQTRLQLNYPASAAQRVTFPFAGGSADVGIMLLIMSAMLIIYSAVNE